MLFKVQQTLVGVHHLLEVNRTLYNMCKRITLVIALIELVESFDIKVALHNQCSKYSAWEAATIRDEVYATGVVGLQLVEALHYLSKMLMLKWLVYADIVVSPAVVCCC